MLKLVVKGSECYDEKRGVFFESKDQVLLLEHSLLSLSKWESKWKKPFLSHENFTKEETMDYVRCMTITRDVDPLIYQFITPKQYEEISDYINDKMTATWFSDKGSGGSGGSGRQWGREIITAEIIYYWMVTLQIPFECEKWHLNRLLTLVRVCNEKNAPAKKMSRSEAMNQQKALNAARRKRLGTKG